VEVIEPEVIEPVKECQREDDNEDPGSYAITLETTRLRLMNKLAKGWHILEVDDGYDIIEYGNMTVIMLL
jgi:hypothetical protein